MTANRIQKAQVRELAKLNGLTYVEAKRQFRIIQNITVDRSPVSTVIDVLTQKQLEDFAGLGMGLPLGTTSRLLPEGLEQSDVMSPAIKFFTTPELDDKILAWDPTCISSLVVNGIPGSGKTVFAKQLAQYAKAARYETLFITDRRHDYADMTTIMDADLSCAMQLETVVTNRFDDRESGFQPTLLIVDVDLASIEDAGRFDSIINSIMHMGRSLGLYCVFLVQSPYGIFNRLLANSIEVHMGPPPRSHSSVSRLGVGWLNSRTDEPVPFRLGAIDSTHSKDNS